METWLLLCLTHFCLLPWQHHNQHMEKELKRWAFLQPKLYYIQGCQLLFSHKTDASICMPLCMCRMPFSLLGCKHIFILMGLNCKMFEQLIKDRQIANYTFATFFIKAESSMKLDIFIYIHKSHNVQDVRQRPWSFYWLQGEGIKLSQDSSC